MKTGTNCYVIVLLFFMIFQVRGNQLHCTSEGGNVTCPLKSRAILQCRSPNDPDGPHWCYTPSIKEHCREVYTFEGIKLDRRDTFDIDKSQPDRYDLIILSVQPSNAGMYRCKANTAFGDTVAVVHLSVDTTGDATKRETSQHEGQKAMSYAKRSVSTLGATLLSTLLSTLYAVNR